MSRSAFTRGHLGPSKDTFSRDAIGFNSNRRPDIWEMFGVQGLLLMAEILPSSPVPPATSMVRVKSPPGDSLCSKIQE